MKSQKAEKYKSCLLLEYNLVVTADSEMFVMQLFFLVGLPGTVTQAGM